MSFLYNVTIKIESSIEQEWLKWMIESHVPDVMNTGFFDSYRICKLDIVDEEDTEPAYVFQYICSSRERLDNYFTNHAPKLRDDVFKKFGNQFFAFRTTMEVIHQS
jgi:hypothetical protein